MNISNSKIPFISESELDNFNRIFKKIYGTTPQHVHITIDPWLITRWRTDDGPWLSDNFNPNLHKKLQKLWCELISDIINGKNTTPRPLSLSVLKNNVITLACMTQMAQNRTGNSSNGTTHMAIGTGTADESISDSTTYGATLQSVVRKSIGSRDVLDQQEQYLVSWEG